MKVKANINGSVPMYQTKGSSGMDLHASHDEVIKPGERKWVGTGLHVQPPIGYEFQVRGRSSLAGKYIDVHYGTIDSDFTHEVKVLVINNGYKEFIIEKGYRIAQMVLMKIELAQLTEEDLEETERSGGFGSTGV
jgi:dUTP pyrophosphatase